MTHTHEIEHITILFLGSISARNTNDSFWYASLNDTPIYVEYNYN